MKRMKAFCTVGES